MKTWESSVCTEEKCFLSDNYLLGHVQKVMKETQIITCIYVILSKKL